MVYLALTHHPHALFGEICDQHQVERHKTDSCVDTRGVPLAPPAIVATFVPNSVRSWFRWRNPSQEPRGTHDPHPRVPQQNRSQVPKWARENSVCQFEEGMEMNDLRVAACCRLHSLLQIKESGVKNCKVFSQ